MARKPPSTGRVDPVVMPLRSLSRKRMASTTCSTSAGKAGVGVGLRCPLVPSQPVHSPPLTSELAQRDAVQYGLGLLRVAPVGLTHGRHDHGGVHRVHSDLPRQAGLSRGAGRQVLQEMPQVAHLVGPELQGHHLGQHVQGTLGGACGRMPTGPSPQREDRAGGGGGQGRGRTGHGKDRAGEDRAGEGGAALTVHAVVGHGPVGGLAGHVHDGSWGSTGDHALGHHLQRHRG